MPEQRDASPSYAQEDLWVLDRLARSEGPVCHEPLAFLVDGAVDVDALHGALRRAVERHETLRTGFVETRDGLRAVVRDAAPAGRDGSAAHLLEVADLRTADPREAEADAERRVAAAYRSPFDLAEDDLLRALLVLLPGERSVLLLTVHQLAADARSLAVLVEEIGRDYTAAARGGRPTDPGPAAPAFAAHAARVRREAESGGYAESVAFWKRTLEDGPGPLGLPTDRPRPPARTFAGAGHTFTVPRRELKALFDLGRQQDAAGEREVLLAVYAVLLHRCTGQGSIAVGTSAANRGGSVGGTAVGAYAGTGVLVLALEADVTFRTLLGRVARQARRIDQDADLPWAKVPADLDVPGDPSRHPVFQTAFDHLGPRPVLDLGGAATSAYPVARAGAGLDLRVRVAEHGDELEFEIEFNTDLFSAGTIERLGRHYTRLLTALAADPDLPVSEVSFLAPEEERLVLDVWNDTGAALPAGTVADLIEAQARSTPDAVAVEFEDDSLSYDALNRLANQVAHRLRALRPAGAEPFVGIRMDRSIELVAAVLGVLKAGFAVVSIDPEHPADQAEFEDGGVSVVLADERHRAGLEAAGVAVLVPSPGGLLAEDDRDPERTPPPDSPAHLARTAGPNGRPTEVVSSHASLLNQVCWMQKTFRLEEYDRVLHRASGSVDALVREILWPLACGAGVVVARPGGQLDPHYLKEVVQDYDVTTAGFAPSLLKLFLQEDELPYHCASLRRVFSVGEPLPHELVQRFYATLSCELHHLYAPARAATAVASHPCTLDDPGSTVPIGRPIDNVRLYVLDRHRRLQPVGVPGELCVGGLAVGTGRHHGDDPGRAVFVADPYSKEPGGRACLTGDSARCLPDGRIEYLGRFAPDETGTPGRPNGTTGQRT